MIMVGSMGGVASLCSFVKISAASLAVIIRKHFGNLMMSATNDVKTTICSRQIIKLSHKQFGLGRTEN